MNTALKDKTSLLACLLHWESHSPKRVYMTQPLADGSVQTYTWEQVGDQVRRMAAWLKQQNLKPGTHIGIVGKNTAHWIMTDLAIWMSGHVTIPLYFTLNTEAASHVFEHSGLELLFVGKMDGTSDTWPEIKKAIPDSMPIVSLPMSPLDNAPTWESIVAETEPLQDVVLPTADTMATILYTSGSTGKSKGVMMTHGSLIRAAKGFEQMLNFNQSDRMLSYLPLAHAGERTAVESPSLYFGFSVYFANTLDTFVEDLQRARPTVFFSVPRLWTKFYQGINKQISPKLQRVLFSIPVVSSLVKKKIRTKLGMEHIRVAITGAAPLPVHIIDWFRSIGVELLEGYGMSENFAYSHVNRPGKARIGTVGEACPGVICRIDESNGEVLVNSPAIMLGYYKAPELTKEVMTEDGFLRTGDMGEIDSDGYLKLTGRVKELFKTSKGKYVSPAPIENKLGRHEAVEAICVMGASEPKPYALLMLSEDASNQIKSGAYKEKLDAELVELLEEVNGELEGHEKLSSLIMIAEPWTIEGGLLTPTMKIQRAAIEKKYLPLLESKGVKKRGIVWL